MGNLKWGRLSPIDPYDGFVATRTWPLFSIDTTEKQIMVRSAHVATEDLTSIKIAISNFRADIPDAGLGATSTHTAAIEYNGATEQVLFGGSSSVVATDNTITFSDYTSVSIPSGATFFVRRYTTSTAGVVYRSVFQNSGLGDVTRTAVSGLTDQTLDTGPPTGGTGQTWTAPPIAIIGRTINPSVLIIGDSRSSGSGDGGSQDGKIGNVAKSMGSLAFANLAVPSAKAQTWATDAATRNLLLPYGSQVIVALGINDLIAGRTAAQIIADIQSIWSSASATKKHCITIEPYTSSSDSWATVGNQTVTVATSTFNDLVRAGISGATGYYEVADVVESARNSGKWTVTPSPPYTADGLHENSGGYTLISASGAVSPASYP